MLLDSRKLESQGAALRPSDYPKRKKMIKMSCPHFSITLRQRSKRQSAVAGAAYQSGEKLFSEFDGRTKNYCHKAPEVVAKGILIPANAPPAYADRQTLWNAVEKVEGQWNSQLARGVIIALPRQLPKSEYEALIRDYCREQFVSRGMIADFAIHDKGDGNPHAHILLTVRAIDENGKWLPKARKVYDLDKDGNRIRLPSGEWKSHKENTVDWNGRKYAELWRSEWANAVNRCFEKHGITERLDLRSFERQRKEELPTVHLGPAVAHMEQKGVATEIGDYNRQIKAHNATFTAAKRMLASLKEWLAETAEKLAALFAQEQEQPSLLDIVNAYFDLRKDERYDWNEYAKRKGSLVDLKQFARIVAWMRETGITTLEAFNAMMEARQPLVDKIKANENEIAKLEKEIRKIDAYVRLKPIAEKTKRGFRFTREKYAEAHKSELGEYHKAIRYLKANGIVPADRKKLVSKRKTLQEENERLRAELQTAGFDTEMIRQIRRCVDTVLHEADIPEKKEGVLAKLKQYEAAAAEQKGKPARDGLSFQR